MNESVQDSAIATPPDTSPEPPARSRRSFLGGAVTAAAAAAATFAAPKRTGAQGRPTAARPHRETLSPQDQKGISGPLLSISAPPEWNNAVTRLVRRATLGMTDADVASAKSMGYQVWLQSQLDYQRIDNTAVEAQVTALWPQLALDANSNFNLEQGTVQTILEGASVFRAALSPQQLYERMVEFWTDHFNIDVSKVGYLKIDDERNVIRKYALGRFSDLVKASSKSAAMLTYLDQQLSRNGAPNQNYARELMELHTLGVNGGYTQDDVAELSRVLTGWTVTGKGFFTFSANIHDYGAKTVMGMTIPASSLAATGATAVAEGESVIDMLCNHPSTATFIATKLIKWLLTPEPTQTQISAIASVFRATKGDIKLVVRAILNSGWVSTAPLKYKRPFHLLVSSLRASKATMTNSANIIAQLSVLGQPTYTWATPDGFPDLIEYWAGNIMPRWQYASTVTNFRSGTIIIDSAPYLTGTADAAIDMMNVNFFGGEMDQTTRAQLLNYLKAGTMNDTRIRETMSLAIAGESFQWY